jgi:pilus assembly protein CpaB
MTKQRMTILGAIGLGLVGTFLVIGYVRGVQARASEGGKTTTVWYAKQLIQAGTPGSAVTPLVQAKQMPARYAPAGAIADVATVKNQFITVPVPAGAPLTSTLFGASASSAGHLAIPRGYEAISIELPTENGVESYAQPGDHVSVFATFMSGAQGPQTIKILSDVAVIATGAAQPAEAAPAAKKAPVSQTTFVLAVTPAQAARIVLGKQAGTIWLTLIPAGQHSVGARTVSVTSLARGAA